MSDTRKPFWCKCNGCGHVFIGHYVPMELATSARVLKRLHCAACGVGASKITLAKQKDGALTDPEEKKTARRWLRAAFAQAGGKA